MTIDLATNYRENLPVIRNQISAIDLRDIDADLLSRTEYKLCYTNYIAVYRYRFYITASLVRARARVRGYALSKFVSRYQK